MEILLDPGLWIGLLTLVVLEVVLGIDNLIFIAILAEKLPPHQRDKARVIGLSLALIMRLALLSVISWLVTLTNPLFSLGSLSLSGRDLILLLGGLFLLYKAVTELHEKIEGGSHDVSGSQKAFAGFGLVVTQIVVLDAVFSLDSVITAIGMVDNLYVMMAAVIIAVVLMLVASKPLTVFVNRHPTVVILCLSFLLMIGISLIAEGLGFHIPKGYIYSGIAVAILIEAFNQFTKRNQQKRAAQQPMRTRAADAIFRLMGGKTDDGGLETVLPEGTLGAAFIPEERYMIGGVLSLSQRTVDSIMVPSENISWIDSRASAEQIRQTILAVPHSLLPVCAGHLNEVRTVARAKILLDALDRGEDWQAQLSQAAPPIWVYEDQNVIECMHTLRAAKGMLLMVRNRHHEVVGLVTPLDVLEAIAGEFPDADEQLALVKVGEGRWRCTGDADWYQLQQELGTHDLVSADEVAMTVAEYLHHKLPEPIQVGSVYEHEHIRFEVLSVQNDMIKQVAVVRMDIT
ncbi:transporter associated domain-containing protein [Snodgrassella sp. CFCC 13594]|uniref:TerC family protein n=1 Tax=Snodgrassella sp. CFCC 13594 TaxID=1775559 RepID=UPI0008321449|nr:transporter associated domain-containing protein [Snodgrassella sp. CFCC 13594]